MLELRADHETAISHNTDIALNIVLMAALLALLPCAARAKTLGTIEVVPADATATAKEIAALEKAATIATHVKNSDCFREFIGTRKLINTNGRAPGQVADQLQSISGTVPVTFYYRCLAGNANCISPTSAVAYRQPPDATVYFNRAHYDVSSSEFDIYELAGSLAHEALGHLLGGYDHSFEWTPDRDFSVPYSISGASSENDDAFQHCRKSLER